MIQAFIGPLFSPSPWQDGFAGNSRRMRRAREAAEPTTKRSPVGCSGQCGLQGWVEGEPAPCQFRLPVQYVCA